MKGTIADWERDRFHRATADAIAALPEADEPDVAVETPSDAVSLLERSYAGLKVEILFQDPVVSLLVQEGEREPRVVEIEPARALDAFNHPYCYLPA